MFRENTTFILGAGASYEAGFPLGSELKQQISLLLNTRDHNEESADFQNVLQAVFHNVPRREVKGKSQQISEGVSYSASIDDYIEGLRDDTVAKIAKLAIAKKILDAERQSKIFVPQPNHQRKPNPAKLKETWYLPFWETLYRGIDLDSLSSIFDRIKFVNFNYDRSLEQFLVGAINGFYGVPWEQAAEIVTRCRIVRPYGGIGPLPRMADQDVVQFGVQPTPSELSAIAGRIRTYSEQIDDDELVDEIKNFVGSSDQTVVLGFGFHHQNLALLSPKSGNRTSLLGTALGFSEVDAGVVFDDMRKALGFRDSKRQWKNRVSNENSSFLRVGCKQFFDERIATIRAPFDGY